MDGIVTVCQNVARSACEGTEEGVQLKIIQTIMAIMQVRIIGIDPLPLEWLNGFSREIMKCSTVRGMVELSRGGSPTN